IVTGKSPLLTVRVSANFAQVSRRTNVLSLISHNYDDENVASLIVRGIDASLVQALKRRAAAHGRSAEAEHREILASALHRPRKRHLAEALRAIPGVGKDDDFIRVEDGAEARRVPEDRKSTRLN